jgi:peroxiredoxin
VRQRHEEFRRLGAEVLVVGQARPEAIAAFVREQPLPFPLVTDPERVAYRAFGLERTRWTTILRPGVVRRYLGHIVRGVHPRKVRQGEDVLQLGGDFILDGEGHLVYAYRSAEPTDRPRVEALLRVVRDLSPVTPSDAQPAEGG